MILTAYDNFALSKSYLEILSATFVQCILSTATISHQNTVCIKTAGLLTYRRSVGMHQLWFIVDHGCMGPSMGWIRLGNA